MDKFVISNKQNITQNLDENITNEQEIHQNNLVENDVQFCNTTNLDNELQNNLEENENNDEKYNIKILNKHKFHSYISIKNTPFLVLVLGLKMSRAALVSLSSSLCLNPRHTVLHG